VVDNSQENRKSGDVSPNHSKVGQFFPVLGLMRLPWARAESDLLGNRLVATVADKSQAAPTTFDRI
jgi:hypothetical protein